jgi:hypothetical protein
MEMLRSFAYLAQGKLFCVQPGRAAERIESPFVLGIEDRRAAERERRGYRAQGMMWNLSQQPDVSQMMDGTPAVRVLRFTSVTAGPQPSCITPSRPRRSAACFTTTSPTATSGGWSIASNSSCATWLAARKPAISRAACGAGWPAATSA